MGYQNSTKIKEMNLIRNMVLKQVMMKSVQVMIAILMLMILIRMKNLQMMIRNGLKRSKKSTEILNEKVVEKHLSKIHKQDQKLKKISELSKKVHHTFSEVKAGEEFKNVSEKKFKNKKSKLSLEERLEDDLGAGEIVKTESGHVMTFAPERSRQSIKKEQEQKEHREERRKVRRSAKT